MRYLFRPPNLGEVLLPQKAAAATDTTLTDRFTDPAGLVEIAGPRGWFLPQVDALLPKPIPTSLAIGPVA